ncbi:CidA/LrgA family protein [Cohnella nanjingensis]|uniref:CidA/LrgA family protein n=1 Tax=Cohnella nanjingensis TaxID=1387779 RepID=A0A7X0VHR7_9BACL|nr:CidA/LrgA family protein [Cohnella nanjingensis]MBB6674425.1 CidA/LrgA family protein [Cohnella nanjingensis]
MKGFAILLLFNLAGLAGHQLLHIPLPGNVLGMLLLLLSLLAGWVKLAWIEASAQFLLKHMLIFFAPTIVGVIVYFGQIGQQWLPIVANLFVSTAIVLALTGWVTAKLARGAEAGDSHG